MTYIIAIAILIASILLIINLYLIIKDFFSPDFPIKEKSTLCADKKCAFYHVTANPNSAEESATCERGVKNFEESYRGGTPCEKSIAYFGKTPNETYELIKKRKRDVLTSISSLAGYLALILSLYKSLMGK